MKNWVSDPKLWFSSINLEINIFPFSLLSPLQTGGNWLEKKPSFLWGEALRQGRFSEPTAAGRSLKFPVSTEWGLSSARLRQLSSASNGRLCASLAGLALFSLRWGQQAEEDFSDLSATSQGDYARNKERRSRPRLICRGRRETRRVCDVLFLLCFFFLLYSWRLNARDGSGFVSFWQKQKQDKVHFLQFVWLFFKVTWHDSTLHNHPIKCCLLIWWRIQTAQSLDSPSACSPLQRLTPNSRTLYEFLITLHDLLVM